MSAAGRQASGRPEVLRQLPQVTNPFMTALLGGYAATMMLVMAGFSVVTRLQQQYASGVVRRRWRDGPWKYDLRSGWIYHGHQRGYLTAEGAEPETSRQLLRSDWAYPKVRAAAWEARKLGGSRC